MGTQSTWEKLSKSCRNSDDSKPNSVHIFENSETGKLVGIKNEDENKHSGQNHTEKIHSKSSTFEEFTRKLTNKKQTKNQQTKTNKQTNKQTSKQANNRFILINKPLNNEKEKNNLRIIKLNPHSNFIICIYQLKIVPR